MTDSFGESSLLDWVSALHPEQDQIADALKLAIDESPGRISAAYREMLSGYLTTPQTLAKITVDLDEATEHSGTVAALDIPFFSLCIHHFLPFFGTIDMVYQPGRMIVGIGKLPRFAEMRARRFQIQEHLVKDLCDDLMRHVGAKGAFVRATARHLCVCGRGPNKPSVSNVATYGSGTLAYMVNNADAPRGVPGG
ncbi:MAG TPA: GTP cyclohydrolase I [Pseudonocardiaceae bacterium]|nr:GTP cyclohydrolase I [Pseudonocardiaceae bacterium]